MNKIRSLIFIFVFCIILSGVFVKAIDNDVDNDGIPSSIDNCPLDYNPNQLDSNHNGIGDICDPYPSIILLGPTIILNQTIPTELITSHASSTIKYLSFCEPVWRCSSWSSCKDNSKSRVCQDINNCLFGYNKPIERTSCKILINSNLIQDTKGSVLPILMETAILFISLIILLILLKFFI